MLMAKFPVDISWIYQRLADAGLLSFGALVLTQDLCAKGVINLSGKPALLIGNAGTSMWGKFSQSPEYCDGESDPMNRWTRRMLDEISCTVSCQVYYPFDEPYWPFQRLAQAAAGVRPSPLGILIHPEYGLWHAFRGLMVFEDDGEIASQIKDITGFRDEMIHPCDTCLDKPCLSACPVKAFTGEQLLVDECFSHLDSGNGPKCMDTSCQARRACPVGKEYTYDVEQLQFHMRYYRGIS